MAITVTAAPRTYARVLNGQVLEIFSTTLPIGSLFSPKITWVETTGLVPAPAVGWSYANSAFTAPPPVMPVINLTSLQFMDLLTSTEQAEITAAGLANATVMLWLLRVTGADYVSLGNPQTIAGVQALVSAGILTAARAAQVLANTPAPVTVAPAASTTGTASTASTS